MIYNYKKYIFKKFLVSLVKVTIVFTSVIIIMNLLEEINFFKNSDEFILLPIYLTLLNAPSVLFEIFPFVFLMMFRKRECPKCIQNFFEDAPRDCSSFQEICFRFIF